MVQRQRRRAKDASAPFEERLPPGGHVLQAPRAALPVPTFSVRNSTLLIGTRREPPARPSTTGGMASGGFAGWGTVGARPSSVHWPEGGSGWGQRRRPLVAGAEEAGASSLSAGVAAWSVSVGDRRTPASPDVRWCGAQQGWRRGGRRARATTRARQAAQAAHAGKPARASGGSEWVARQLGSFEEAMARAAGGDVGK
eukprot:g1020.t1